MVINQETACRGINQTISLVSPVTPCLVADLHQVTSLVTACLVADLHRVTNLVMNCLMKERVHQITIYRTDQALDSCLRTSQISYHPKESQDMVSYLV